MDRRRPVLAIAGLDVTRSDERPADRARRGVSDYLLGSAIAGACVTETQLFRVATSHRVATSRREPRQTRPRCAEGARGSVSSAWRSKFFSVAARPTELWRRCHEFMTTC
jgi:hypothetical protein